ncbi:MAG TPA: hypothetical protein VGA99_04000 [bacterium]
MKVSFRMLSFIALHAILFFFNCANRTLVTENESSPFQKEILEYALSDEFPRNGTYRYYWAPTANDTIHLGTTKNIDYLGTRLSTVRENRGTHCVGISWQVCMKILQDWSKRFSGGDAILNLSVADMKKFIDRWFIKLEAQDSVTTLAPPQEKGAVYALTSYNLGDEIPFDEAQAGDFVQFWRKDNTGHSCIFLNWILDHEGNIIGLRYWGSQPQTNGIGTDTELFDPYPDSDMSKRLLVKSRFYAGRLAPKPGAN